ncbi:unnamed protein product [Moneuplotes crassus]|uniref:Uncharacterized protein n=2 Tax=Euplotes crassus TaxID=5936 RepID=A0AAD1XSC2_EUPCR|nr:unnamed protein product [Moneuplotes crassus]
MEQYPPTLDVRFTKDHIMEVVKDKYQLNAYLLGQIFSVTKDPGTQPESSDSDTSSEENYSLFESSDEDSDQERVNEEAKVSRNTKSESLDRESRNYQYQRSQYQANMSVTRSALAKEATEIRNKEIESREQYNCSQRKQNSDSQNGSCDQDRDKLKKYEKSLDLDLIKQNSELNEVYKYYLELKNELKENEKKEEAQIKDFKKLGKGFRHLMKDIKQGSSKDDLDYKDIYQRVLNLGIFPEGNPELNDWCREMNDELKEELEQPYCYSESEELWTKEEEAELKVLKL